MTLSFAQGEAFKAPFTKTTTKKRAKPRQGAWTAESTPRRFNVRLLHGLARMSRSKPVCYCRVGFFRWKLC